MAIWVQYSLRGRDFDCIYPRPRHGAANKAKLHRHFQYPLFWHSDGYIFVAIQLWHIDFTSPDTGLLALNQPPDNMKTNGFGLIIVSHCDAGSFSNIDFDPNGIIWVLPIAVQLRAVRFSGKHKRHKKTEDSSHEGTPTTTLLLWAFAEKNY